MTDSAQALDTDASPTTGSEATIHRLARAMLRGGAWPTAIVACVAVVVAAVLAGGGGAVGAALGALIVSGCCWLNIAILRWTAPSHPMIAMASVTGGFVGKLAVLMVLLVLLRDTTLFDTRAFGFTIMATVAAWTVGEVVGFARARVLTIAPEGDGTR